RRIGHARWLRNVAVALGNALQAAGVGPHSAAMRAALTGQLQHEDAAVREHVRWALGTP
ncbi:MAG: tRNA epoxyqueuosine(34) reductase QueG, partial [Polaromonas sp.]|nr:tRNA epoxyqueuosine(34) reductase QueG [Polaromonas sp.]